MHDDSALLHCRNQSTSADARHGGVPRMRWVVVSTAYAQSEALVARHLAALERSASLIDASRKIIESA